MKRRTLGLLMTTPWFACHAEGAQSAKEPGIPYEWHRWRTDGICEGAVYPAAFVVQSAQELGDYYEASRLCYRMEGLSKALARYTDAYFEEKLLVVVLLEETSGATGHEVTGLACTQQGLAVQIKRSLPGIGTQDMAQYHIMIEVGRTNCPNGPVAVSLSSAYEED